MRVTIRLYKRYDIDLLSLYHNSSFPFLKHFKSAIRNYIRGTPEKITIPEPQDDKFRYDTIQFQMYLHPVEDKDIIAWIRNIKAGYKNSILKNIFRNSLNGVYYYYIMNIHHADEMQRLNEKSATATIAKSEKKKEETKEKSSKKEQINEERSEEKISNNNAPKKTEIAKENDLELETQEEQIEEIETNDEIVNTKEETVEKAISSEPESSNDLTDINDSYEDEEENDVFDNNIFAIAGKMMQGL